jgi:predicted nucleotidyltransferase
MQPNIHPILTKLQNALLAHYGEKLSQVILFGSQARGDAKTDSDIDVLVVLEDNTEDFAREYERWSDWVSDELLESGELVNLIITSRQRYDGVKSPLYLNAHSEGIVIYDGRMPVTFGEGK